MTAALMLAAALLFGLAQAATPAHAGMGPSVGATCHEAARVASDVHHVSDRGVPAESPPACCDDCVASPGAALVEERATYAPVSFATTADSAPARPEPRVASRPWATCPPSHGPPPPA